MPFTTGAVYANRVYREYLRENGLFHRCFAFTYLSLQQLIDDGIAEYSFRLIKKRVSYMKNMPRDAYPLHTDTYDMFLNALRYMENIVGAIYGDDESDERMIDDHELFNFYAILLDKLSIGTKFRYKKFNVINLFAHFICISTVWNTYLSSAVSFQYCCDVNFCGLKIRDDIYVQGNDIQSYVQYCAVVLCKGIQYPWLVNSDWKRIIFEPKAWVNEKYGQEELRLIFDAYLTDLKTSEMCMEERNIQVTLYCTHPKYLQSSVML